MHTSRIAIALVVTGLLVVVRRADAKPPPCPGGRYLVTGTPLTGAPGVPMPDVVDVAGRMVSVQSGCDAVKARVRATAKGTKVRVKWMACRGVDGKARLKGTMTDQCRALAGTFAARSARITRPFVASLSTCGDGVWDAAGGEECDAGLGPCGGLCTACACPGSATTSTTIAPGGGSSTSTMPAFPTTSTTSTTLPGPDLAGLDWMSPGSAPSGSNIAVQFSVRNFGTATAGGPWYDYILLSNDYAVGNDTAVAVVQRVSSLAAGAQYTVLVPQVPIPAVPPGTYYLFLHTDGANAVAETNETNNLGGLVQLTVTP